MLGNEEISAPKPHEVCGHCQEQSETFPIRKYEHYSIQWHCIEALMWTISKHSLTKKTEGWNFGYLPVI